MRKSQALYPLSLGALGKGWLISRYDDAIHLLKNEKLKKNYENVFTAKEKRPALLKNEETLTKHMLNSDPLITTACELLFKSIYASDDFAVGRQNPAYRRFFIDKVQPNKFMNLVDDYAFPLPIIVISEMLGIPLEDRQKFRVWSQAIIDFSDAPERLQENDHLLGSLLNIWNP